MDDFKQSLVGKTNTQVHKIINKLLPHAGVEKIKYAIEISNYSNFRHIIARPRLHELFPIVLNNSDYHCVCDIVGDPIAKSRTELSMTCNRLMNYSIWKLSVEHFIMLYRKISPGVRCKSFDVVLISYMLLDPTLLIKQKYVFENSPMSIQSRVRIIINSISKFGNHMQSIVYLTNHLDILSNADIMHVIQWYTVQNTSRWLAIHGIRPPSIPVEFKTFVTAAIYRVPQCIREILHMLSRSIICDNFYRMRNGCKMILIELYVNVITIGNFKMRFDFNMFKFPYAAGMLVSLSFDRRPYVNIYECIVDYTDMMSYQEGTDVLQYICEVIPIELICSELIDCIDVGHKFGSVYWWLCAITVVFAAGKMTDETYMRLQDGGEPWKIEYIDGMFAMEN